MIFKTLYIYSFSFKVSPKCNRNQFFRHIVASPRSEARLFDLFLNKHSVSIHESSFPLLTTDHLIMFIQESVQELLGINRHLWIFYLYIRTYFFSLQYDFYREISTFSNTMKTPSQFRITVNITHARNLKRGYSGPLS